MTNKIKKSISGFSILEVLITLFIIGVVLVIYGAASNTVLLNRNSNNSDLAHYIAVSEMEDLRNLGYDNLPVSGVFSHSLLGKLPEASATLTVSSYNSDTKEVTVTITWKDPRALNIRNVTFTTLINKYGL